jgi:hypothetical protein
MQYFENEFEIRRYQHELSVVGRKPPREHKV